MENATSQVSCLLLPVQNGALLLPNAAVAEIEDYQEPEAADNSPEWLLGYIRWRGIRLPLISYDAANENAAHETPPNPRIAVTNTIDEKNRSLPFIALLTHGLPRLLKVKNNEINKNEEIEKGPADKFIVKIGGEEAAIPDLEYLESLANQAMGYYK